MLQLAEGDILSSNIINLLTSIKKPVIDEFTYNNISQNELFISIPSPTHNTIFIIEVYYNSSTGNTQNFDSWVSLTFFNGVSYNNELFFYRFRFQLVPIHTDYFNLTLNNACTKVVFFDKPTNLSFYFTRSNANVSMRIIRIYNKNEVIELD